MHNLPIYLDYMATTPVDPQVADVMNDILTEPMYCGNPSSFVHAYGHKAAELVEQAREQVAALIQADPREIYWTSGASEANNMVILGAVAHYQRKGRHVITMSTEHKSVLATYAHLEKQGYDVTYLAPQATGLLDLSQLEAAIQADTVLMSVMCVNNETGVVQDIAAMGEIAKKHGVLLHVDAAQAAGKVTLDMGSLNVDFMSLSAHKLYGPKGVGVLYMRRQPPARIAPILFGGAQEKGVRPGTLATHQIVGMGKAFAIAKQRFHEDHVRIGTMRDQLWKGLQKIRGVQLNGCYAHSIPHCLNVMFDGIDGEALLTSLQKIAVSAGSACNAIELEPSYVLIAMGRTRQQAGRCLRISLGRFTTPTQVEIGIDEITLHVDRLRQMSPIWETGG